MLNTVFVEKSVRHHPRIASQAIQGLTQEQIKIGIQAAMECKKRHVMGIHELIKDLEHSPLEVLTHIYSQGSKTFTEKVVFHQILTIYRQMVM